MSYKIRIVLIAVAVVCCWVNGILSVLAQMTFTSHERTTLLLSTIFPWFLWLPAFGCLRFPKVSLIIFFCVLGLTVVFGVGPNEIFRASWYTWERNLIGVMFALLAGILLLINFFIPVDKQKESISEYTLLVMSPHRFLVIVGVLFFLTLMTLGGIGGC